MLVMTRNPARVSFRDWDNLSFCKMLAHYWDQPLEEIYGGTVHRASSVRNEQKQFRKLDSNMHLPLSRL
jgi:hypothetical protein